MRKSFKVMPGVRMTVTPRGLSASVGVPGSRVTVNSRGRVTQTVGIPGSGVSYSKSSSVKGSGGTGTVRPRQVTAAPSVQAPQPVTPGLFAPRWEKSLHKALREGVPGSFERIGAQFPEARPICMLLDAFSPARGESEWSAVLLEELWVTGFRPEADAFLLKYASESIGIVSLAPGVAATLPLSRDLIGLALAECRQGQGDLAGAVDVVENLEPSLPAAVSLAELYTAQGRWDEVIELTNGVVNSDDFACFLLSQRGIALREKGFYGASREAFKQSLARRSQAPELKHHTLAQRSETYRREGKRSAARRDLERIMADNPAFPGLAEALAALQA